MIVEENIFVMLLQEARFKDFIIDEISDTSKATEVLTALSAASRQEVDETLAKALSLGGKEWRPVMDYGFMYGCSFQDPGRPCVGTGLYGATGGQTDTRWGELEFTTRRSAPHSFPCKFIPDRTIPATKG